MGLPPADIERPTTVSHLAAGAVEYRLERRGERAVVIFHGGHMRASLVMGERIFADAGCTVLVPSRPGYGRTPLSTGRSVPGFADVTRQLCESLGISAVTVVGTSAGGHTAVTMAARHPDLVKQVLLLSAVSWLPWPPWWERIGTSVAFNGGTERLTWAAIRALMTRAPDAGLRLMLRSTSVLPIRGVIARLRPEEREYLIGLFMRMRAGRGFLNDLSPSPDVTADVSQPTLIIAAPKDGAVPLIHAKTLAATIPKAELVESQAETHFVWFAPDWPQLEQKILHFLDLR
jgi:pimeloyl-ACP methyl ester carboxylesterase